jgi:RNA ligase
MTYLNLSLAVDRPYNLTAEYPVDRNASAMTAHIAHQMSFDELIEGLRAARDQRLVYERPGAEGLVLYTYSDRCVYDSAWTPITMSARGLIVDPAERRIVATPFPKFFNVGERGEKIPDLPFDTMEKLDGSLIVIFHHNGQWRTATRGALGSSQAAWARAFMDKSDTSGLRPGTTYLAEATYSENRIVVRYTEDAMVMLAAYDEAGIELPYRDVEAAGASLGWRTLRRYSFNSISDLMLHAEALPRNEEGFVVRFENGHRIKIKGNEYKRMHALISRVTPLALWEVMAAGDDLEAMRRDLPEEFWDDFDAIKKILGSTLDTLIEKTARIAGEMQGLSDKDVGLRLSSIDPDVRGFVFPYRKSGGNLLTGRNRQSVFRALRPDGNELPGYVASYAMKRLLEEDT